MSHGFGNNGATGFKQTNT